MHVLGKAAVVTAAAGLLAFGAVAGNGGSALANPAPPQYVTGCAAHVGARPGGQTPNCEAIAGKVVNPTVIGISVDTSALSALLNAVHGVALDASWTLSCVVNGRTVTNPGSYDITSTSQNTETYIYLQTAVGSPEPGSCTISDLLETTSKPLDGHGARRLGAFNIGVVAVAQTAVPGAINQDERVPGSGAHEMLCADDTANGNAGSKIQAFQCESDLAQNFVQTAAGQLVHNGDCLGLSGDKVFLSACVANDTAQEWGQSTAGGPVRNMLTLTCLTAPSVSNGTQLTVTSCGSGADQKWHLPAAAEAIPPCGIRTAWRATVARRAQC